MVSKSFLNLSELELGLPLISSPKCTPRGGGVSMLTNLDRVIVVAVSLPLRILKNSVDGTTSFAWDEESILLQLKTGLPKGTEVIYVGCIGEEEEAATELGLASNLSKQEEISASLFENFRCIPAFVPADLWSRFFHGFCKLQLWPLFHYMSPLSSGGFHGNLWQAYKTVNKLIAQKVTEVISPEEDLIWVHDYQLMLTPSFLRKKFHKLRLGFFLHSPFPSSEVYKTLPVREEILRALLNADLIGFHTFDYARHFLSCCSRLLGLQYASKRGYIGLEYYGRIVGIKILPAGVHMGALDHALELDETACMIRALRQEYVGRTILLGVDDLDVFKGIGLKLLAMEEMLKLNPELINKVMLIQIVNPPQPETSDARELLEEIRSIADRINENAAPNEKPVVLIERQLRLTERIAYYNVAECCVVMAARDGLNLTPYEYEVCRHGNPKLDSVLGSAADPVKKSVLIVSEFIGCSPSLSGAIRVNPWNTEASANALCAAVRLPDSEKKLRHENHYRYIRSHDVAYWAQSFITDLQRSCNGQVGRNCYEIGFGLNFRVVALDPNFRKLHIDGIASAYIRASTFRLILLDYDGTVTPPMAINRSPSSRVLEILNTLCKDPLNVVFVVSGRGREPLAQWFSPCNKLGIAAEHGFFYRWSGDLPWESSMQGMDFSWMESALPILNHYTERTDGSSIEAKDSALVWHYQDADPDFGSWQAKELLNHLENVLANEPVSVKSGQYILEVKPQGISKGVIVEKLLSTLADQGRCPDFVLCVGDDRSDEDMFESIENTMKSPPQIPGAKVFACTVGQKPSKAKYYLDDTVEVVRMLTELASVSSPSETT